MRTLEKLGLCYVAYIISMDSCPGWGCSSGERQSSGLSNCSINVYTLRSIHLLFLICRNPVCCQCLGLWVFSDADRVVPGFPHCQARAYGLACWLPTSCLPSGFQKFTAIDSFSVLSFIFGFVNAKNYILVFQWDFRQWTETKMQGPSPHPKLEVPNLWSPWVHPQ